MITERYRSDYTGEFVVLETKWSGGRKTQTREWIDNPIENHHISGRAAVIGTNFDQHFFDHRRLERHRGGLLGSKKLQTYGTGPIAKTMRLDFAIETNQDILKELVDSGYTESNIVYTNSKNCILRPGQFYLIPHNPLIHPAAAAVYLAAFDCHKEIFLLGYNIESPIEDNNWQNQIASVMQCYSGVKFTVISNTDTSLPNSWMSLANVTQMRHKDFVSYCDV